jgi:murein DD-endopeptidase MepM/ murein hydrolase activator NlpD
MNVWMRQIAPYALLVACVAGIYALQPPPAPPLLAAEETVPVPPPPIPTFDFPVSMSVCAKLNVANAPAANATLHIIGYSALIEVNEAVLLARAPVEKACVSSGFGARNNQPHTGIDYYNLDPVSIYAAGDGVIREAVTRADFGNMLVIDHGHGVFTRYAHLDNFDDMEVGASVISGQVIGVMGNTAATTIPRHLHYEILTGTWGEQAGSFALTPTDPLALKNAIE